jgi:hypothetical protein
MVRNKILNEPVRLTVSLVAGAAPDFHTRVAAVSPTFGRLFEGTDPRSPGQTSLYHDNPGQSRERTSQPSRLSRPRPHDPEEARPNVAEPLATRTENC